MRTSALSREEALALLEKYNKEPFHVQHALTVEGVMRFFAKSLGYGDEEDYWGIVGLLHDIDFELYPEQHCKKARGRHRRGYDIFCLLARIRHLLRCRTEARNGKGSFRRRRAYGTDLVGGAYASVEKRFGHGGLKSKKEIQGQEVCSRLLA